MRVLNIHERALNTSEQLAGEVLDSLAGPDDRLWPGDRWPRMEFDSPLGIGARGGHGPVRYTVQDYVPGRKVVFQFALAGLANGLEGRHWFEIVPTPETTVFRHVIDAECGFVMWLKWAFLIRPLHDALLEDAFDKVELDLHGRLQRPSSWSLWVRTLRKLVAGRPVKRT